MIPRYTRQQMAAVWSPDARFALWLEIECLLVEALEARGEAPAGTADRVRQSVRLDPDRIAAIEAVTHHDVIAFLTHVEEQAGEPARFLHLGLTSSDVLDTAYSVQLCQALDLLAKDLAALRVIVGRRASEFAQTPMIGRTHGMHAEPLTFGLVWASWAAQLDRDMTRLRDARSTVAFGKLSGAVGTYAHLDPAVERFVLDRLNLTPEPVATQVVPRDRHAQVFCTIALLGTTIERIAVEVRHLQRTEVGEAEEPFEQGQKGSSAMPHKRNPIRSENLCGLARLLRAHAGTALENVALWHERDISHSSVERVIGPDATILLDFMYHRLSGVLDRLAVYPERMRANLDRDGGFPFSQAVLLALVKKGLSRQRAYEMVQSVAMRCYHEGGEFLPALLADRAVCAHLNPDDLARCFDLRHSLRHTREIIARIVREDEVPS